MNKSQVDYAERKAKEQFDKWNEVTGFVQVGTGYYVEMESVIEDAVHIGIQMALYGKVEFGEDGSIKRNI